MSNDAGRTRWARELNERDVREMREKGPGGVYCVTPPPKPWHMAVAWAVLVAATWGILGAVVFVIGAVLAFAARVIFE